MTVTTTAVSTLSVERVSVSRGGRQILHEVSMTARAGEILAVVGPSGSGKSTLLAVLAGLEPPDSGHVVVDQVRRGVERTALGLVLQGYGLVSTLTAAENVELALQARGTTGPDARAAAAQRLEHLGLDGVSGSLVDQLSGGQQQRVAVARALVTSPAVVLADEPTAELDPDAQDVVMTALAVEAARGALVVLATHDPAVAARCQQRLRLRDGRVVTD